MDTETVRWILIGLAAVVIGALVRHSILRARELAGRIDEYHASENESGARNPYEDIGELYGSGRERKRGKRS